MYESLIPLVVKKITGNVERALHSIGVYLTSAIVTNIDRMGVVDTGRLKGSITHEVDKTEVRNGTNVEQLLRLNPNLLPSDFVSGQVICLPTKRRVVEESEPEA